MSAIKDRKTRLQFTTEDTIRYRRLNRRVVVEVDRHGLSGTVRLENTKTRFHFSFAGLYHYAARIAADKAKAEKKRGKR